MSKIPLVLFAGPIGESVIESIVDAACAASVVDMFADARKTAMFSPLILVSDHDDLRNKMIYCILPSNQGREVSWMPDSRA